MAANTAKNPGDDHESEMSRRTAWLILLVAIGLSVASLIKLL